MSNINGKVYGLTAITRMHPLKTFGVRATFLLIEVCLLPKAARGAVGGLLLGIVSAIVLGVASVAGLPNVLAREGALVGAHGTLAGLAIHLIALAALGAIAGSVYQPEWTL